MAFLTLEDEHGTLDIVLRKEVYEEYGHVIRGSKFLVVEGRVQRRGGGVSLLATEVESFGREPVARPHVHGEHPRSLGQASWRVEERG